MRHHRVDLQIPHVVQIPSATGVAAETQPIRRRGANFAPGYQLGAVAENGTSMIFVPSTVTVTRGSESVDGDTCTTT